MKFWEIGETSESDYAHVHTSGKLEHPYQLPVVDCEKCGAMVGRVYETVLPYECPPRFRKNPLLRDNDVRISVAAFRKLTKAIAAGLPKKAAARLVPRALFQPGFLDVPSIPEDDFLWSDLRGGLDCMVVSERVRRTIKKLSIADIEFYPCTPRRIGDRSPKSAPRIPKSGEPFDMMKNFTGAKKRPDVPPYFQLLVFAESGYPPGDEPQNPCELCGEDVNPDWAPKTAARKSLTPRIIASLSKGLDIFRIPEHGTLFVTDRLKSVLEEMKSTNIKFKPFPREPVPRAMKP